MAEFAVLTMVVDLHFPHSQSLKARRAVLKPVIEGVRRRWSVSCADVSTHDTWQRARLVIAAAANSATHASEIVDGVERWLWSVPDAEITGTERLWLDTA